MLELAPVTITVRPASPMSIRTSSRSSSEGALRPGRSRSPDAGLMASTDGDVIEASPASPVCSLSKGRENYAVRGSSKAHGALRLAALALLGCLALLVGAPCADLAGPTVSFRDGDSESRLLGADDVRDLRPRDRMEGDRQRLRARIAHDQPLPVARRGRDLEGDRRQSLEPGSADQRRVRGIRPTFRPLAHRRSCASRRSMRPAMPATRIRTASRSCARSD